jgi:hypothetical protein
MCDGDQRHDVTVLEYGFATAIYADLNAIHEYQQFCSSGYQLALPRIWFTVVGVR